MSEELDQPQPAPESLNQAPQSNFQPQQPQGTPANMALGIIGIVAGVIGLLFAFIPCVGWILAVPLGLGSIVCGAMYWYQASQNKSGIALGLIGFIIGLIALVVIPGKWIVLSYFGEKTVQSLPIQNLNNTHSPYSYQTDSTEIIDVELEDVVEDIVEDEEEE